MGTTAQGCSGHIQGTTTPFLPPGWIDSGEHQLGHCAFTSTAFPGRAQQLSCLPNTREPSASTDLENSLRGGLGLLRAEASSFVTQTICPALLNIPRDAGIMQQTQTVQIVLTLRQHPGSGHIRLIAKPSRTSSH